MAEGEKAARSSTRIQTIKFEDLLSKYPAGEMYAIANLGISRSPSSSPILNKPRLKLYCKEFKKAVETISDAIPQVLLINGYNPLALLEQALTKGSYAEKDHDALRLAAAIRKILTELAERMARALEDQTDLDEAVNTILQHD